MKLSQWSQDTADAEERTDIDYMSCSWGGCRAKKQRLRTNMHSAKQALNLGGMASAQCHDHQPQEWEPWITGPGSWVMPWQAEEEHPARSVRQKAVATYCETAKRLQSRLSVPCSPALKPLVGGDKSWWTTLPAETVSELTMVPIGIRLMPCPPKNERHIPPVLCASCLQQLPEGAVRCGTRAAQKLQAEAKFVNPFEGDILAAGTVMMYIDSWLRMTSTEQLECVSSLGGRVLITDSMPDNISHAHFLAAMVVDHAKKEKVVVTSAHMAQIPHEGLTPSARRQLAGLPGAGSRDATRPRSKGSRRSSR